MTTLKIMKSKTGTYKIISNSTQKHPALVVLANLLRDYNRHNSIHVGVYNVSGGYFENRITVYSYISGKKERMNRSQYSKWLKGTRQITESAKTKKNNWLEQNLVGNIEVLKRECQSPNRYN